jgi:hypothetical protein
MLAGLAVGQAASAQTMIGAWSVSIHGGHARPVKTAVLVAPDGASLVVACDAHGVDLMLSYLERLPSRPQVPVQWRLDGGAAHSQSWGEGPDHGTLSPGDPAADAAVLRQFAHGRTLTLSAAGRRSSFQLDGVKQVAALIGDCPAIATPAAADAQSAAVN